ncbi:hypothetical protein diail_1366 [Diaporthe ilicicola]|nr:hypothetical protein diail_1366 [Diaporthe ilicicola]
MPSNGDTSNYTSVFRLTPPGDPHRKVIKRNRQVVSFFGAHGTASLGSHTPPVPRKQIQVRLQQLEDLVNGMIVQPESTALAQKDTNGAVASRGGPQRAEPTSSRGEAVSPGQSPGQEQNGRESNSVRYAGSTNYAAVLECIHNLQEIVDEEAPDYLSENSQQVTRPGPPHEAQREQQKTVVLVQPHESTIPPTAQQILDSLPSRADFLLGVPPVVHSDDVDTQLPSNLHDEEFSEESKSLPKSRPVSDFTPALPYIFHSRQVKVLRRVVKQAIAIAQPSYSDVVRLDAELRSLHDDVPPCLRYRPIRESSFADAPDIIVRRMIFEIIHLKGMCVLHRRYLTVGRENAVYDRSREACLDASFRLLDLHAEFDEQSVDGGRLYEKRYMVANAGLHVFLLAAMCLCLDLVAGSGNHKQSHYERGVSALKRARTIWSKPANASKESAHATKVLDSILTKISPPDRISTPHTNDNHRQAAAAAGSPSSSQTPHSSSLSEQPGTPTPSWSAVNNKASSSTVVARKEFSVAWDFGLDNFTSERMMNRDFDDPLDMALNGDVDWNELDALLLDRERIGSTVTTSPAAPVADANPREGWPYIERGGRTARENWSYPQYDHKGESEESSTNFRTWGRGGPMLGLGPS